MNPFNHRAIAARRDADLEDEARRDMEAFERFEHREFLGLLTRNAGKALLAAWLYAEAHGLDPDQAVEDALAALDDLRARPATPDKENDRAQ
jgi:hypothetical protein